MVSLNHPTQVVLVTSQAEVDVLGKTQVKEDIITIGWHMPTSFEPMLYAISVGKTRFSCKLIRESKAFVVNFMPYTLGKEVLFCGTRSGEHMDKFKESGLAKEGAEKIDCPRVKEASAYIECEVIQEIETGDHIIFVGSVVHSEAKNEAKRLLQKSHTEFTTTE
jgi:flavin reductase (DIM6/NTAB) family NADH-FMN oxidoreductase RutF|tara:strand:- start:227 stop:718 length:492 start_codon:yes stop_codon:yes gene_type:complete